MVTIPALSSPCSPISTLTGAPREILSDQAGDLTKGIERYQQRHAETAAVGDVAHYGANVLENRWERDPRWAEMVKRFSAVNQQIRQTADAYLLSPTLRNKARFMSVGPLLRFARRVLALLKRVNPNARARLRYGWLLEYEEDLARWLAQYDLVEKTIKRVRLHGLNSTTLENLEKEWGPESADADTGTRMVRGYLRVYVRKGERQLQEGETLAGSSEILESAFGKLKAKAGESGKGELTGMAMALGTILGKHEEEAAREGLENVPQKKADGMIHRLLGPTVRWLRHQLFAGAENPYQFWDELENHADQPRNSLVATQCDFPTPIKAVFLCVFAPLREVLLRASARRSSLA